jgi:hypothetical protein
VYFAGNSWTNVYFPSGPVRRVSLFEPNVSRTSALATGFELPPPASTTTNPLMLPVSLSAAKTPGRTPGWTSATTSPRSSTSGRHALVSVNVRMSYSWTRGLSSPKGPVAVGRRAPRTRKRVKRRSDPVSRPREFSNYDASSRSDRSDATPRPECRSSSGSRMANSVPPARELWT